MKLRPKKGISVDRQLWFTIGRLVDASENVALLLQDPTITSKQLKPLGERLDKIAQWFLDQPITSNPDEAQTMVLPPYKGE